MSIKNLLIWNPDPHPNLQGYDVTVNAGPATLEPSNVFLDPSAYANQATADAIVYAVAQNVDLAKGSQVMPELIPAADETPTLRVTRLSFDDTVHDFCVVTGSLLTIVGTVPLRAEMRFSIHWEDTPAVVPGAGYILGGEISVLVDALGRFKVPLLRQTQVFIHVPEVHLHGTFIVPDEATKDLKDIGVQPVDLFRNN